MLLSLLGLLACGVTVPDLAPGAPPVAWADGLPELAVVDLSGNRLRGELLMHLVVYAFEALIAV